MTERTFTGTAFPKLKQDAASFCDRLIDAGSKFQKARAHRGDGGIRHITVTFDGPDPDDMPDKGGQKDAGVGGPYGGWDTPRGGA